MIHTSGFRTSTIWNGHIAGIYCITVLSCSSVSVCPNKARCLVVCIWRNMVYWIVEGLMVLLLLALLLLLLALVASAKEVCSWRMLIMVELRLVGVACLCMVSSACFIKVARRFWLLIVGLRWKRRKRWSCRLWNTKRANNCSTNRCFTLAYLWRRCSFE